MAPKARRKPASGSAGVGTGLLGTGPGLPRKMPSASAFAGEGRGTASGTPLASGPPPKRKAGTSLSSSAAGLALDQWYDSTVDPRGFTTAAAMVTEGSLLEVEIIDLEGQ